MSLSIDTAWRAALWKIIEHGEDASPRGMACREVLGYQLTVEDPRRRVMRCTQRKLNYRFMATEFAWIAIGSDLLFPLERVNNKMRQFSDDGKTLWGAYGIPWVNGIGYVIRTLRQDPDSRQAVISLWKQPGDIVSRDVPCTLTFQFLLRDAKLHLIATMRSSDAWLGLPYDAYNFMSLQVLVADWLCVGIGTFMLNTGSLHLYAHNLEAASAILGGDDSEETPPCLAAFDQEPGEVPAHIYSLLYSEGRSSAYCCAGWEQVRLALVAKTSDEAFQYLIK